MAIISVLYVKDSGTYLRVLDDETETILFDSFESGSIRPNPGTPYAGRAASSPDGRYVVASDRIYDTSTWAYVAAAQLGYTAPAWTDRGTVAAVDTWQVTELDPASGDALGTTYGGGVLLCSLPGARLLVSDGSRPVVLDLDTGAVTTEYLNPPPRFPEYGSPRYAASMGEQWLVTSTYDNGRGYCSAYDTNTGLRVLERTEPPIFTSEDAVVTYDATAFYQLIGGETLYKFDTSIEPVGYVELSNYYQGSKTLATAERVYVLSGPFSRNGYVEAVDALTMSKVSTAWMGWDGTEALVAISGAAEILPPPPAPIIPRFWTALVGAFEDPDSVR